MTYTVQEILDQIEAGEDSSWEFKQVEFAGTRLRSPKRAVLADEIAAFANSRGGVLLCGVTDDGRVQRLTGDQVAALDAAGEDLLVLAAVTSQITDGLADLIERSR
ncbi:MAG: ATP-binding protein [Gemmatimonadota bacterium]|nr:ATP-binding protein [Gemmatimonadota bacterium]